MTDKNTQTRSERYAEELEKLLKKREKMDEKIRVTKERMEEAQKVEVYEYMQAASLSPRQLKVIIEHASKSMPGDLIVDLVEEKEESEEEGKEGAYGE